MTDRKPFEPIDGTARWRKVYDLVVGRQINDEILYREVEDLLDCDRTTAQAAMLKAVVHLEEEAGRSVRTVTNFGWIVMRAAEHINESDRRLKRARNQAKAAVRKISAIDSRRDELSQFEREAADRARMRASAMLELSSRRPRSLSEMHKRGEIAS